MSDQLESALTRHGVPSLLDGFVVTTPGNAGLPVKICAEHLSLLGASWEPGTHAGKSDGMDPAAGEKLALRRKLTEAGSSSLNKALNCTIGWQCQDRSQLNWPGTEALVQAISGLMSVHGRDRLIPRRLGLEVASVAAGIVATQGVLAGLFAGSRHGKVIGVETSVLRAALLFLCHHIAIATCGSGFPFRAAESAPGPPFCTADGHWVELEILTGDAWKAFWTRLGVEGPKVVGAAWLPYVYRYLAGSCALPPRLHEATRQHTLVELSQAADMCGVAVCRVRTYSEVLAALGWPEGSDHRGVSFELRLGAPWTIRPGAARASPPRPASPVADGPLAGLRVIEVTSRLQGPLAGLLLRMLGANVLKVEPPGGDFGRHSPPLAGSLGAAYLAYNRGKQWVQIDYKRPEGRTQLLDLVAGSDVFLHNWPPGRAQRLGFDFEDLAESSPGLIYAHASGWGGIGDQPSSIAGDFLIQAHAGCGDGLNPADEPAFPSRLTLIDVVGGLLACEGILAALCMRERSGHGCRVDTSLFAGAMSLQAHILRTIATQQEGGRRLGRPLWGPLDQPIKTANGFLVVTVEDERTRQKLAKACGVRTSGNKATLGNLIAERLQSRPAAEWESLLLEAGISAATVCDDLAGLPSDPRVVGLLESVNNACWVPAAPWSFEA